MAVTKIQPIKSTLKKALDYICNPKKTDDKILISSYGCSYETADIEFGFTLSQAMEKGNNLAHHLMQSFEPGEVSPEQAHKIGKQLADEVLGGKHEYVLTTHIDKGHVHNHVIFCAANFVDNHKYVSNKKSYSKIRNVSDRLCHEYGLSVVAPSRDRGKGYAEYTADKAGTSWKSKLKTTIDAVIPMSKDFEDFLRRMEAAGYEIKRGKYISFRAPGQERFTRSKTLGEEYTSERITERIHGKKRAVSVPKHDSKKVGLLIDIENSIKAQESRGYSHWAKLHNLKEAARTVNFLTENSLLQYMELQTKVDEVTAANDKTLASLKDVESRLSDMALLIKNITAYQKTKPTYDGYLTARNKSKYRQEHESRLILHEAAVKALKAVQTDSGKLPNVTNLQREYTRLTGEKQVLYAEYGKLKKQVKKYSVIKRNVDSILKRSETDNQRDKDITI